MGGWGGGKRRVWGGFGILGFEYFSENEELA